MLVLLIGFVYHGNKHGHQELVSGYVDLYHLYNHFKDLADNVVVLTDLIDPYQCEVLVDAVTQNQLPESVIYLNSLLTSRNAKIKAYKSRQDLEEILEISDEKEIFVYFSGHSLNGNLLLPDDKEGMDSLYFRRKLMENNPCSKIFMMFDCCDADGTRLPYVLEGGGYKLNPGKKLHLTTKEVICLCSTKKGQNSLSKIGGSVFTHCFLNQIDRGNSNLEDLLGNINKECGCYEQTATIYASLPNLHKIWSWLYKKQ